MVITILIFILSKIFVSHFFGGNFGLKIWSFLNWLKFGAGVHYYTAIIILMFIFLKVLSFIQFWVNLVPKSVVPVDRNLAFVCIINIIFWLQSKAIFFCSKYYGQISFLVFSILTELRRISILNFNNYGEQQILGWNFPPKIMNVEQLHIKAVISI